MRRSISHLVVVFGTAESFLVDLELEHVANRHDDMNALLVEGCSLMPSRIVGVFLLVPIGPDDRGCGAGRLFADVVEHQVVLLQCEAQQRRGQQQETSEDVRILHLAGELSLIVAIISC